MVALFPISICVSVLVRVLAVWMIITLAFFTLTVVEAEKIPYCVAVAGIELEMSAVLTNPVEATETDPSSMVVPNLRKVKVLPA